MNVNALEAQRRAEAGDWLLRLQSDELDANELTAWLDWYGAQPENGAVFEELQREYEALRSAPVGQRRALASRLIESGTALGDGAGFRTEGDAVASVGNSARGAGAVQIAGAARSVRLALAAAVSALALGAALFAWNANRPASDEARIHTAAYQTPRAQHRTLDLADGSAVELGAASSLSLNFTGDGRYLVLEGGEAYFKVAKDARRPFVVQVGEVTIRALGTAFNIRRAQDQVIVAVSEGSVEVSGRGSASDHSPVRLTAGEQANVNLAHPSVAVMSVSAEAITAWQHGRLEFVNEPLGSVIETVNRYAPRRIVLTDRELAVSRYTGTVNEDRIEEWLTALPEVFPIAVTQAGADAVLLSTRK